MVSDSKAMEVVLSIVAYSFCSGTLLLLNKLTLHYLPYPSLVTTVQLLAALVLIYTTHYAAPSFLAVDPIQLRYVIPYCYYIIAFALGVYCNMKSLSLSNVETVIVFKALSPCFVSVADFVFLGRELPSYRSAAALALIVVGSIGYASQDEKFQTQGISAYMWPFFYLVMISFEMIYGKSLLKSVDLKTLSGPVIYTNLLGIPPMLCFALLGQEYSRFIDHHLVEQQSIPTLALVLLLLSCAAGTGIGYSSWWCRGTVSATSFSLIGVMNKCLTILLNLLVWDQHSKPWGIFSLFLCLAGGALYRQAPLRSTGSSSVEKKALLLDHTNNDNQHNDTTTGGTTTETISSHNNGDLETAVVESSHSPPKSSDRFATKQRAPHGK